MKQIIKLTAFLGCLLFIIGSCEKDTEPTWVAPEMTLEVVKQSYISRTGATLEGNIGSNDLDIAECGFAYSETKALLEKKVLTDGNVRKVPVSNTSGTCRAELDGLKPGVNYFYCLYITCGSTTVISPEILQFTTTANNAPELKEVTMAMEAENTSMNVKSAILSIGADEITLCGFCYAEGAGKDPSLADKLVNISEAEMPEGEKEFTALIDNLEAATDYSIRAYAMNDAGSVGYGPVAVLRTANADKPTLRTYDEPDVRGNYAVVNAEIVEEGTSAVTKRGFCWSSTNASPMLGACEGSNEVPLSESMIFSSEIKDLQEGTTYYVRSYAVNEKGIGYGNRITFTTISVNEATVGEVTISGINTTAAQFSSSVTDNGNGTITERGFCWSASNQTPAIGAAGCESKAVEGESFTLTLDNLEPNQTTYWVRAYAKNQKGISYSAQVQTFRTSVLDVPGVETPTVNNITINSAEFTASIITTNNSPITEKGFCWSQTETTPDLKNSTTKAVAGNSFTLKAGNLKYGSVCYVRAYAKNGEGVGYSAVVSFNTTDILAPSLNTLSITERTPDGATLTAVISSSNNGTIKEKGFCWSSDNANPTVNDSKKVVSGSATTFTHKLTGLQNNVTYYVCAYAENEAGISYTAPEAFTTVRQAVPDVSMPDVNAVTVNSATLRSTIDSENNSAITERGFCWNTTGNTPNLGTDASQKVEEGDFTCTLTGLDFGKTYYVWAYAKNAIGTGFSPSNVFTTVNISVPGMYGTEVSDVTINSAKLSVTIYSTNNGNVTRKGFCWSTTKADPTVDDSHQDITTDGYTLTHQLKNLTPGTIYYVRAYAENEAGLTYNDTYEFQTIATNKPSLSEVSVDAITVNGATVSIHINDKGNLPITSAGFYWSETNNDPSASDQVKKWDNPTTNTLTFDMTGLKDNTTYYIRAFATNSKGTTTTSVRTFTTKINPIPDDGDMENPGNN